MNLNQITLPSNDISASRKFYLILGFTLIVDSEQYLRFWCEEGDATFSLHLNNDASFKNAAVIYFECVDVDKKYQTLLSLGFEFLTVPTLQSWAWYEVRLLDPSGNELCLFHAAENRKTPPWGVNIRQDSMK